MPATVINGLFSSSGIGANSGNIVGQVVPGLCLIPNNQPTTITLNNVTITGGGASAFSFPAGQLPVTLNPGQSAILEVDFTVPDALLHLALLTVNTSTVYTPTVSLSGQSLGATTPDPQPSFLTFPTTKVGQTSTFSNVQIYNPNTVNISITNITLVSGVDFAVIGAPVVPFTILAGQSSALFGIQFAPTVVGGRNDTLNVVDAAGTTSISVGGVGSTLQSAFSLTGATQGMLFAFPGGGSPLVLLADPTNLNSEAAGSFVKLHDFQIPNREKQLMRIRGHYEDLGIATVTFTVRSRRIGQADETGSVPLVIGTAFVDGWIREFISEPIEVTGELIQITISRAAAGGPVSIIDYMPEFEPKGEVIGGT